MISRTPIIPRKQSDLEKMAKTKHLEPLVPLKWGQKNPLSPLVSVRVLSIVSVMTVAGIPVSIDDSEREGGEANGCHGIE